MAALDIILTFLDIVLSLIMIFITIVIFHPINKYKKYKVKEDQLFLQKTLITTLFFCIFLVFNIMSFFSESLKKYIYIANTFIFNAFYVLIILYNLMMTIEVYRTYHNPVHYFNRLFRQKKYNYIPEFIIILICVISLAVDFGIDYKNIEKNSESEDVYLSILVLIAEWKPFATILISIICLILYFKLRSLINSFYFNNQKKLLNAISKRRMNYYLYLVFGIFYLFPLIEKVIREEKSNSEYMNFFLRYFFIL